MGSENFVSYCSVELLLCSLCLDDYPAYFTTCVQRSNDTIQAASGCVTALCQNSQRITFRSVS